MAGRNVDARQKEVSLAGDTEEVVGGDLAGVANEPVGGVLGGVADSEAEESNVVAWW